MIRLATISPSTPFLALSITLKRCLRRYCQQKRIIIHRLPIDNHPLYFKATKVYFHIPALILNSHEIDSPLTGEILVDLPTSRS